MEISIDALKVKHPGELVNSTTSGSHTRGRLGTLGVGSNGLTMGCSLRFADPVPDAQNVHPEEAAWLGSELWLPSLSEETKNVVAFVAGLAGSSNDRARERFAAAIDFVRE